MANMFSQMSFKEDDQKKFEYIRKYLESIEGGRISISAVFRKLVRKNYIDIVKVLEEKK